MVERPRGSSPHKNWDLVYKSTRGPWLSFRMLIRDSEYTSRDESAEIAAGLNGSNRHDDIQRMEAFILKLVSNL